MCIGNLSDVTDVEQHERVNTWGCPYLCSVCKEAFWHLIDLEQCESMHKSILKLAQRVCLFMKAFG